MFSTQYAPNIVAQKCLVATKVLSAQYPLVATPSDCEVSLRPLSLWKNAKCFYAQSPYVETPSGHQAFLHPISVQKNV
jgi:hypothetical protein